MAEKKDGAPSDRIDMVRALGRELFGGPSSGPGPGDAARRFLHALEAIGAEYADDDHRGYVAALAAVDALCLLLGRPDLGDRFRDLGKGLADLHGGQEVAPILRRPEGLQASGRTTVDWGLA